MKRKDRLIMTAGVIVLAGSLVMSQARRWEDQAGQAEMDVYHLSQAAQSEPWTDSWCAHVSMAGFELNANGNPHLTRLW